MSQQQNLPDKDSASYHALSNMAACAAIALSAGTLFVFFAGMFKGGGAPMAWPSEHPIEAAAWVVGWFALLAIGGVLSAFCWKRAFQLHDQGY